MSRAGHTLRELRLAADLSLRHLADRVFVHWTTLRRYEAGTRSLPLDAARALDVALDTGGTLTALVMEGREVLVEEDPAILRVAPDRFYRPKSRITYIAEAEAAGRELHVEHDTVMTVASAELADRLGIRDGDAVSQTSYRIRMNSRLVCKSTSWEPLALTGGTPIQRPHEGPYADTGIVPRFDAIGYPVTSLEEAPNCRMPEGDEAALFEISSVTPLMTIAQTFLSGSTVVEVSDMVFHPRRYDFHYRMEIPS